MGSSTECDSKHQKRELGATIPSTNADPLKAIK